MDMEYDRKLEECLAYFKARPIYGKLFLKIREKYMSLGHLGGKVILTGLSQEDKQQLGGFFRKDYTDNNSVTISAVFMEKALADSKFSDFSWEEILTAYFEESLIARKELERQRQKARKAYFDGILGQYDMEPGKSWLQGVLAERGEGYQLLMQQYRENPEHLGRILGQVLYSIQEIPFWRFGSSFTDRELLAVFAARTTGDPHYYDEGTMAERLLTAFLKDAFGEAGDIGLSGVERKNHLLYKAGLLKDDLSNDTLAYGVHAAYHDGKTHEGIEGFCQCGEPVRITLSTLGKLGRIWPGTRDNRVYVVENPAVFSILVKKYPCCTAICGNGQPRLATLILMDMLQKHCVFLYAGDFDPEGLLIAQRLKERYGEKLHLWNYRVEWYEKYLSKVILDETRLKKLERIYVRELLEMKKAILREKRAAYQEALVGELLAGV